ncbi:MAG: hypothetical protein ACK5HY_04295 [Parahaliea sp.]
MKLSSSRDRRLLCLLGLSIAFLFWSLWWTVANLYTAALAQPQTQQHAPDLHRHSNSRSLDIRVNPLKALFWLRMGYADNNRPNSKGQTTRNPMACGGSGEEYFIRALRLRPAAGSYWAQYADYCRQQGASLHATQKRLNLAIAYAPASAFVRKTAWATLMSYADLLDERGKEALALNTRYLMRHTPGYTLDTAVNNGWAEHLRQVLTDEGQILDLEKAIDRHRRAAAKAAAT